MAKTSRLILCDHWGEVIFYDQMTIISLIFYTILIQFFQFLYNAFNTLTRHFKQPLRTPIMKSMRCLSFIRIAVIVITCWYFNVISQRNKPEIGILPD